MSYRIRAGEALGPDLRRVYRRQIKCAMGAGRSAQNGRSSPVHETRKHLKKARAALALLGGAIGKRQCQRMNAKLRKVAHLLSDVRDAEVRLQTMEQLRASTLDLNGALEETETLLGLELESFRVAFSDWQAEAAARLRRLRGQISCDETAPLSCQQVRRSVQKSYKRGRAALRDALRKPTPEAFHDFRKRAKQLMYQMRILSPLDPAFFAQLGDELSTLTEQLGKAHDLVFLGERLAKIQLRGNEELPRVIERRSAELERTAAALGQRFFAERPKQFGRRLAKYFEEWKARPSLSLSPPRIASAAAVISLTAFLLAVFLSAAPGLHAQIHPDAAQSQHECAITIVEAGTELNDAAPVPIAPRSSSQFATIPSLKAVWVAASFLNARVFEHAPPLLS